MAFVDVVFPDKLGFGSVGGPGYATDVVEVASGHEQRNQRWAQERHRYDLAMTPRLQEERDEMTAFFRRMAGKAHSFRFRDWADYQCVNELLGTGNGSNTVFQARKAYQVGLEVEYRTLTLPRLVGAVIRVDNVVADASVNTTTGVITLASAPGNGAVVTGTFDFDVPVRFDHDTLRWRVVDRTGDGLVFQPEEFTFVEVRV